MSSLGPQDNLIKNNRFPRKESGYLVGMGFDLRNVCAYHEMINGSNIGMGLD
jgi:hypothetical protein